jgi:cytochrome c-type biogenesis protein CcsB
MALLLSEICAVFYAIVAITGLVQLFWPRVAGDRIVLAGMGIAILAHAFAIGGRTVQLESAPITNMNDALSVFAFLVAIIAALIAWRANVAQAAPLAALLAAGLVLIGIVRGPEGQIADDIKTHWLAVHIAFAFLGDASFAIAGIVAAVFLVQERKLKSKKKKELVKVGTGVHSMPALEVLDKVSINLIQWGFPLMTLGLLSGAFYAKAVRGFYWSWDPLSTVSLMVWVLYAVLLHFRITIGWRGRKLAVLTVLGVVVTLIAFVGLGIAGSGAHGPNPANEASEAIR